MEKALTLEFLCYIIGHNLIYKAYPERLRDWPCESSATDYL